MIPNLIYLEQFLSNSTSPSIYTLTPPTVSVSNDFIYSLYPQYIYRVLNREELNKDFVTKCESLVFDIENKIIKRKNIDLKAILKEFNLESDIPNDVMKLHILLFLHEKGFLSEEKLILLFRSKKLIEEEIE